MNDRPAIDMSRADIRAAAKLSDKAEIAYLVSTYYVIQEYRKAAANQARTLEKDEKPAKFVGWIADTQRRIEDDIKVALDVASHNDPAGSWLRAQHGIGPVIAAGLIAHLDVTKAPTAGAFWRFAGLDPSAKWEKGKKRPWNADLKVLCWKLGDSFVKSSGSESAFYGAIYRARKEKEVARNEAGVYAETASATLAERKIKDAATRAVYEAGKLPAGRLDLRARRIAVKMLLAHLHDVMTWHTFGRRAPRPYSLEHMGHAHYVEAPNPPWGQSNPLTGTFAPSESNTRTTSTAAQGKPVTATTARDKGESASMTEA